MSKLFVKAIVNTLVGIFAAAVVAWAVITLAFPSALVTVTANMGWTRVSAWYAASSYVRTRDLNDLAQAVDMSINIVATKKGKIEQGENVKIADDDYKQVVKYCSILIRMDGFDEFCTSRDNQSAEETQTEVAAGTCKNYYYAALVEAYYNTGYKTEALKLATLSLNETSSVGITSSSAICVLSYQAIGASDAELCAKILAELQNSSVEHNEQYESIVAALSSAVTPSTESAEGENRGENESQGEGETPVENEGGESSEGQGEQA